MNRFYRFGILLLLPVFCTVRMIPPARGAETGTDSINATYRLEEIVVYGPRTLSSTSMTTTLTAADIQEHGGWTVADLLRSDAGLNVTNGAKAETETRIRGFPGRDVLVLVDGHPINPGYYGRVDLSMLPLDNAAQVAVIKGPASVAYGPNAMGGVISIITQNGRARPRTVVESEFGDYEYRRLSLNHSRQIRRVHYWLSVYEHHSSGFRLSRSFKPTAVEDGGLRRGSSYHKAGVDTKIGFQSSPTALYALSAGYHWAEKDVSPTIYSWDSPTYRTFPWWARVNTSVSGNWHITPLIELKSVVFADAYHDRLKSFTGPEMRAHQLEYDSNLRNWSFGVITDGKIEANRFHWVHTGISLNRDGVSKKADLDEPYAFHQTVTAALFAQDNYRPWQSLEMTTGLGLNIFTTDPADGARNYWCPMVCWRQSAREYLRFRGGWSRAIRFPTLHDLYSEGSGNPDLKPEEAGKFELAVETTLSERPSRRGISLAAAFFHSELRNQVYRSAQTEQYQNIGSGKLQGWEFRSTIRLTAALAADIAYAYLNPGISSRQLMEETAPNHWSLRISANTTFHTRILYELNRFDSRTTYLPTRALPAYGLHTLRLEQDLGQHLAMFGSIQNMFDADYEDELGYPNAGRQCSGGVRWVSSAK